MAVDDYGLEVLKKSGELVTSGDKSDMYIKTSILASSGDAIDTHEDADGGTHLGTAIIQTILTSLNNNNTANLASGATFTGEAEETFGINAIQVYHFADQDCRIYLDQSLDGTNWDIVDTFDCLASNACTRTFTSVAPYFRLRVTNIGLSTTTAIRSACGMAPVLSPLPRALTEDDRLKSESTLTGKENTERHVWVSPNNGMKTQSDIRLIGTTFDGITKDPNFWSEAVTGSGTVTQSGEIQLDTGTTANSTAQYNSVRKARFVVGSALQLQSIAKFVTVGTVNNIRRVGAYNDTDGFFFQLNGSTFSIGFRKASSDTLVNTGSFNGNYGPNYIMNTSYHKLVIEWTLRGVFFYIDGKLLHKDNQGHRSNFLTLPIRFENINSNGLTTDVAFDIIAIAIVRQGALITNNQYKYIGTNTTTICKYGAGTLQTIVNLDNAGALVVYDNIAASGTIIASIDTAKALGTLSFNAPFSTGLTIVSSGGAKVTVIYE